VRPRQDSRAWPSLAFRPTSPSAATAAGLFFCEDDYLACGVIPAVAPFASPAFRPRENAGNPVRSGATVVMAYWEERSP